MNTPEYYILSDGRDLDQFYGNLFSGESLFGMLSLNDTQKNQMFQAAKYLFRRGLKPGESEESDIQKFSCWVDKVLTGVDPRFTSRTEADIYKIVGAVELARLQKLGGFVKFTPVVKPVVMNANDFEVGDWISIGEEDWECLGINSSGEGDSYQFEVMLGGLSQTRFLTRSNLVDLLERGVPAHRNGVPVSGWPIATLSPAETEGGE